jgi:hypothetical protein
VTVLPIPPDFACHLAAHPSLQGPRSATKCRSGTARRCSRAGDLVNGFSDCPSSAGLPSPTQGVGETLCIGFGEMAQALRGEGPSAAGSSMDCYSAEENSQIVAGVRVGGGL